MISIVFIFGAKPLPESMLTCQLDPYEQTSVNLNRNSKLFVHENASQNIVCELAATLSKGQWVNNTWIEHSFRPPYSSDRIYHTGALTQTLIIELTS